MLATFDKIRIGLGRSKLSSCTRARRDFKMCKMKTLKDCFGAQEGLNNGTD